MSIATTLIARPVNRDSLSLTVPTASREQRIPALDGLRGVAILMVLFDHLTPDVALPLRALEWVRKLGLAGWVGVDLFFVLSGFLITGILLEVKGSPGYFKNFYGRRILRIFPLYYISLLIIFCLLPAFGFLHGGGAPEVIRHQGWTWFFSTNIGMWLSGRSGFISNEIAVSHFWSLAVEEHFYLVWPAIVLFVSSQRLAFVCLAGLAASLLIRGIGVFGCHAQPFFFLLTPCRLDGLMIGAWLAIRVREHRGLEDLVRPAWIIAPLCGLTLAVAFLGLKGLWPTHWLTESLGLSVIALGFGALLVLTLHASSSSLLHGILGSAPLRFLGRYSYATYIIHGLIGAVFARWLAPEDFIRVFGSPTLGVYGCLFSRIVLSVFLGFCSWHLLEKHFLKLKQRLRYSALPATQETRSCRVSPV